MGTVNTIIWWFGVAAIIGIVVYIGIVAFALVYLRTRTGPWIEAEARAGAIAEGQEA